MADGTATPGSGNPTTGEPANGQPGQGGASAANAEPPAYLKTFMEQMDKRLEGLATKLRETAPAKPPAAPQPAPANGAGAGAPASSGDPREELLAAIRFGEVKATLTDGAKAKLDEFAAKGWSFGQLADLAEALKSQRAPANGGPNPPPGIAANAAPSTAPRFPTSWAELQALKTSNPAEFQKVWDHPTFDPQTLWKR